MANMDTGEIRPWKDLSAKEKASGKWIPLPSHDENGEPVSARPRTMLDDLFPKRGAERLPDITAPRSFDATGKVR